MKAMADPDNALGRGLAAIRVQFKVPDAFPAAVLAAANAAAGRAPTAHADRTAMRFVTLDPAGATDLDQAFAIEAAGGDLLLHYAIADVVWFVDDGGPLDTEAWTRGETLYLPDGKAPLYPPVLSQGAASLLPDGPRPAVIFTVRIAPDGAVKLDGTERAVIRSQAKLAYETATADQLPDGFDELSRRIAAAEDARGAARVDPPQQEVDPVDGGGYSLAFRPYSPAEQANAALSLAANMAIADALLAHHTGLFRVMAEPDAGAIRRLRHTAAAFGLNWASSVALEQFERTLDPADPKQAAFMLAIRRAGRGASYVPYQEGVVPWHSAMAATYAHATAPLRRLADRYVVMATLAIANGQPVPPAVTDAFVKLPQVMAKADALAGRVERAVVDLAETVLLREQVGDIFPAVVTDLDERGARMQLTDLPVVARVDAKNVTPGDKLRVRLTSVDPVQWMLHFDRVN
ncbi:RNB domain-containing ribonuclease [Sphingomonas panacisoli]|uniref:RNB domain-containing ribonuclease n=1 Tax=Sphingomonas panacisoli TaxID=1813879 RepID=A0A5B8LLR8_9SPHN|nr:RNB domain-containing ribonuclease [Sphingomonas panacisoli]QDZ08909.1 RNB domain-containing ribonuclease [Sphingomonas panacisoli]